MRSSSRTTFIARCFLTCSPRWLRAAVLLYETFAVGNAAFGKPGNPAFLLAPRELLDAFAGLRVIAFEDGYEASPRPAMVQRIAATRPAADGAGRPESVALRPA